MAVEMQKARNVMPFLDDKLARGLAREIERRLLGADDTVRQQGFALASDLLRRNQQGRKIDASQFNPALAQLARAAGATLTTLGTEQARLRLGHAGCYRRQSLQREPVEHFRPGGADFQAMEWTVAVDQIRVERGIISARFWTAPVLFERHLIARHLERGGAAREQITRLIERTLPLAGLCLALAFEGQAYFRLTDVVLPAEGGVLCGGTEYVACDALAYRFTVDGSGSGGGVNLVAESTLLQPVVALRTYLDDGLLTPGQRQLAAELRAWTDAHHDALRAEALAAYGWQDSDGRRRPAAALLAAFAPLHARLQDGFLAWRHALDRTGYARQDFRAIAARRMVPAWQQRRADPALLDRYVTRDTARPR